MKNFIVVLFACFSFYACGNRKTEATGLVGTDAFEKAINDDDAGQLIDVRTPEEYNDGHIAGAQNIDIYSKDFYQKLDSLKKGETVYVYCKSGRRSAEAAAALREKQFTNVVELQGGITAWQESGKPVEK